MAQQFSATVLMVRPAAFGYNLETAGDNHFQKTLDDVSATDVRQRAIDEFDAMVVMLRKHGVRVVVIDDTSEPITTDAVFPNNWISFHADGRVVLYPMCAPSRRLERRLDVLDALREQGFAVGDVIDWSSYEANQRFLEGTGALVLDHLNRVAYCAISNRAEPNLFDDWCRQFGYEPVAFTAKQTVPDGSRQPIYHTNVMLSIADDFAVVCLDAIDDRHERDQVTNSLRADGKQIIAISEQQTANFAGNCLQLGNANGEPLLVLSQTAFDALSQAQRERIEHHCPLLPVSIPTIETLGGGSARCMLAEVFLPRT